MPDPGGGARIASPLGFVSLVVPLHPNAGAGETEEGGAQ